MNIEINENCSPELKDLLSNFINETMEKDNEQRD